MQLAPVLDIAGSIQRDSALNMQAQDMQFNQGQVKRVNAKEDAVQAQIPVLLQQYKSGDKGALAAMAGLGKEGQQMASTLMQMEEHNQMGALRGMQMQSAKLSQMRAQAAIKKEQVEQDLKAIGGLQDALKGVESPADKNKIKKMYLSNYERMGGKVPDLLKGDWEPAMDKDLENLAAVAKGLLQRDGEGFTLGENQVRYDANGKVIASGPKGSSTAQSPEGKIFADVNAGLLPESFKEAKLAETTETATKEARKNEEMANKAGMVVETVNEALDLVDPDSDWFNAESGVVGPLMAKMGGTDARQLEGAIDTIKANLSFDELAKMRANSPTGGALGGIAVKELDLLGATVAKLDVGLPPKALRKNLEKVKTHYEKFQELLKKSENRSPDADAKLKRIQELEAKKNAP